MLNVDQAPLTNQYVNFNVHLLFCGQTFKENIKIQFFLHYIVQ